MPGAGTDKTRNWVEQPGPCVILVEPQLADNIGAAARAMANFGLSQLRLVAPRESWPAERAYVMASGANRILDAAQVFDDVEAAIGDLNFVLATTARAHDQAKPVVDAGAAARLAAERVAAGERVGLMFGRERNGLENHEVALADRIITLPVNPAFASLNLAQAVVVVAYEWFKLTSGGALPFAMPRKSQAAPRQQMLAFFANLERELEKVEFFRPPDKRETMQINLRNIFSRMQPTQQDIQTLSGVIMAIAEGRKGPARGGVLDGEEAGALRALLAEHDHGRVPGERGPVRGLSRLLRRNPTDAERALWEALTRDRRFSGMFKRQTPIGPHINDFVSFQQRMVIDVVPEAESDAAARVRAERHAWLQEHDYRVVQIAQAEIGRDVAGVLDRLAAATTQAPGRPREGGDP
jgi:tRNA/rRNA methyltransferase